MVWNKWQQMNQQEVNLIPEKSGVYQLNTDAGTLYHGQTTNLKRRLNEHFNSSESCIQKATKFCYQITDNHEKLEKDILKNYKDTHGQLPPCNEQER